MKSIDIVYVRLYYSCNPVTLVHNNVEILTSDGEGIKFFLLFLDYVLYLIK